MTSLNWRRPCGLAVATMLVVVSAGFYLCAADQVARPSIFRRGNLVAWCIVPFDAAKRTPIERATMLKRLGFTKLAYDWRAEHVPGFEDEIRSMQREGIEFFAFWSPAAKSEGYDSMMRLIGKYKLHPQIWMIAPSQLADSNAERVARNARAMQPFLADARRLGCQFALYNHGGWSGQPDNLIAMVRRLRQQEKTSAIGIVYNFHHGHEHLDQFPAAFQRMLPYLLCVNLDGVTPGGPIVLPLGHGEKDLEILKMVRDSGYSGPIGILDHRADIDAEKSLGENLRGLKQLLGELGDQDALQSFSGGK